MADLPKIVITREQIDAIIDTDDIGAGMMRRMFRRRCFVTTTELPTKVCSDCNGDGRQGWLYECSTCGAGSGTVPLVPGDEAEVGYWEVASLPPIPDPTGAQENDQGLFWRPVAVGTVTQVLALGNNWLGRPATHEITLTDLREVPRD